MSLWDQVRANMAEWYAVAADKTGEAARVGVRKYDQFAIAREIERALQELGSHVYAEAAAGRHDLAGDAKVRTLCDRVRLLEDQAARKQQEIEAIRAAGRGRAGPGGTAAGQSAGAAAALPAATGAELPEADPVEIPAEVDDEEIEASLEPGRRGTPGAGADDLWDEEIAVWHEPLELDAEPEGPPGAARKSD